MDCPSLERQKKTVRSQYGYTYTSYEMPKKPKTAMTCVEVQEDNEQADQQSYYAKAQVPTQASSDSDSDEAVSSGDEKKVQKPKKVYEIKYKWSKFGASWDLFNAM